MNAIMKPPAITIPAMLPLPAPDTCAMRSTRCGLLSRLEPHEGRLRVIVRVPGGAPIHCSLVDAIGMCPALDAVRSYTDYRWLAEGRTRWAMSQDGTFFCEARRPCNPRPLMHTPWGPAQTAHRYGPGVVFYSTAGHGGFLLDTERLAAIPRQLRALTNGEQGNAGWFEEDEDWSLVALAHPDLFDAPDIQRAADLLIGEGARQGLEFWTKAHRDMVAAQDPRTSNIAMARLIALKIDERRQRVREWNPASLRSLPVLAA